MAEITWNNPLGGDFANSANWSGGSVPGASDDALLTAIGTYTVTSSQSETVNSLQMIATVTFAIEAGTFYAVNGSGSGTDAGLISVANGAAFQVGGTLAGSGTVQINSSGNGTNFTVATNTTLSGGGKLVLSDNSQNYIISGGGGLTLTNVNDVISGAGQLGYGSLAITNQAGGTIDATGTANALILNAGGAILSNSGLIEATGAGGFVIQGSTISQSGAGVIKAVGSLHNVMLNNGTILGGLLATSGGGVIESVGYGELNGVGIAKGGVVTAINGDTLGFDNTITNQGTIALQSSNNGTTFIVQSSTVTLTGGGQVQMSDNTQNYLRAGNGSHLINVNNTISGSGYVGYASLAIDNQTSGIINSTGTAGMTINTGSAAFTNEGLIEDTGTGGLQLQSALTNSGTIGAFGAGATFSLSNGSITGGTLKTSGGGQIQSINNATFDGITLAAGSVIAALDNTSLFFNNTISNGGTIALDSAGNGTNFFVNTPTVTLTGGGVVHLSDSTQNYLRAGNGNQLINVNNTISGSGFIGYANLAIDNQAHGVINSSGTAGMTINSGGAAFTNEGLIEDTGKGGITLSSTISNTGTIGAFGAGTSFALSNGTILGGTLTTSGGGQFLSVNNATFDSITLTTGSVITTLDNTSLFFNNTISNGGTIALNSAGNATNFFVNTAVVTLTGGGVVQLSDNTQNYVRASNGGDQLVNFNNLIEGSGFLAYGNLAIDNQARGVIDSSGMAGMTINSGGAAFTNEGLIEDTGKGGITLFSTISNTGTIGAFGAGTSFALSNGTILGGTLTTSGGGQFLSVNNATFDSITLTTGSVITTLDNTSLFFNNTISNGGTIALNSAGNATNFFVNTAVVTLTGGGVVQLSDNTQNYLRASNGGDQLVNFNNLIEGSGILGYGSLIIDNQKGGTIDSSGTAGMFVNPGGSAFTNEGLVEATGTGGLTFQSGTLTNTGTMAAQSGSFITVNSNVPITNYAAGTLTGGTWEAAAATSATSSLALSSIGAITTDAATLVLSGAGASISAGGTLLGATLSSIVKGGELAVQQGATFAASSALTDLGTILLTGVFSAKSLSIGVTGTLDANGVAALSTTGFLTDSGTVLAGGGANLTLSHGIFTGNGSILATSGGTITLGAHETNKDFNTGTLTAGKWEANGNHALIAIDSGTVTADAALITLIGTGSSLVSGSGAALEATLASISATGSLSVLTSRGFASSVSGGMTDNGVIALGGGVFSTSGLTIGNGGLFQGGGTLSGTVIDNGTIGAVATGIAGSTGTLSLTGPLSGSGALTAVSGTNLILTNGYSAGSLNVAAGGTIAGAGSLSGNAAISGLLALNGGIFTAGTISVAAGGRIAGSGTVATAITSSGSIAASGGTLTLAGSEHGGALSVSSGAELVGSGGVAATSLSIAAGGSFAGSGTISGITQDSGSLAATGALTLASVSGAGSATIDANATLTSSTALKLSGGVGFAAGGAPETLALGTPKGDSSVISGFGTGTVIDLLNTTVTSFAYSAKTGTLSLKDGTTALGTLKFAGSYTAASFQLGSDGHGGTDLSFTGVAGAGLAADLTGPGAASSPPAPTDAAPALGAGAAIVPQTSFADLFVMHMAHAF